MVQEACRAWGEVNSLAFSPFLKIKIGCGAMKIGCLGTSNVAKIDIEYPPFYLGL